MNQKIIFRILLIAGLCLAIYSAVEILNNLDKKFDRSKSEETIFGRDDLGNMLNLKSENAVRKMNREKGAKQLFVGIVIIIIAFAVRTIKRKQRITDPSETINQLEKLGKLRKDNLITEDEFEVQKRKILKDNEGIDASSEKGFRMQNSSFDFDKLKEWVNKNQKILKWSSLVIGAFTLIYFLFLRVTPERDGRKVAGYYCDCENEKDADEVRALDKFIKSFKEFDFTNRAEARLKYREEFYTSIDSSYSKCINKAQEKHNKIQRDYVDDVEALTAFGKAYAEKQKECDRKDEEELKTKLSSYTSQLSTIEEQTPDAESIKQQLIGHGIFTWNFDKMREFKTFEIKKVSKTGDSGTNDSLFCLILTTLKGDNDNMSRQAELMVVYRMSPSGWIFNNVKANYVAWDNPIPHEGWFYLQPQDLNLCTMTWDMTKKILMKTNEDSEEYLFGPDSPTKTIPASNRYLIQSREGEDITVKFKYYPRNTENDADNAKRNR